MLYFVVVVVAFAINYIFWLLIFLALSRLAPGHCLG